MDLFYYVNDIQSMNIIVFKEVSCSNVMLHTREWKNIVTFRVIFSFEYYLDTNAIHGHLLQKKIDKCGAIAFLHQ